ncbi:DJ-1/PfpI family protein [Candidatus Desantisbacteria bacterium]|nr:DJ-1/PfpI family protein [Candidatus Desantisbacteria bacterium]
MFIIANSRFRDEELLIPKEIISQSGATVSIASSSLLTAKGVLGARIEPDLLIDKLNPKDFDAVIFVGGGGAREYYNSKEAHRVVNSTINEGKILGAICIAPVILANAGVLKNKKATVFPSEIDNIKKVNVIYTDANVVVDGNIITARGPEAAREFGEAIRDKLYDG